MACFTLSAIVVRLLMVRVTDRLGQRVVLMAGLAVCTLASLGYNFVASLLLIFLRVLGIPAV